MEYKHDYMGINCISLIDQIYKEELGITHFDTLWKILDFPEGKANMGRAWIKKVTFEKIDEWATQYAKKVSLTKAREYDVIVFKSRSGRPFHFGMCIGGGRFIHVQQDSYVMIDYITSWIDSVHLVYRSNEMV